jgi:hypothetical protein
MATNNKKFRIQNGANIQGELSFDNVTVIDSDGLVAAASVQPAVESIVNTTYVNALNVTAFDALTAQSVTDISSFTTTDITEGANLYFTAQRARDAIQAGVGVSYDAATGEVSASLTGGEGITVSGDEISFDGSAIAQDIVPSVDNLYSLGSPDKVWRDVYIGPGSLYINGTKILEDNSGTITMYADPGQNLAFGVTDGGSIDFNAGNATIDFKSDMVLLPGKTITTSGGNATVFGGDVNLSGNNLCDIAAPQTGSDATNKDYVDGLVSAPHVGDKEFGGSVTVQGDLTVQGTTTTVNSETLTVADNIIDVNSNVTSGTPTEHAGLRVMRGDEAAAQIRWNEASDHWETFNGTGWTKVALSTDDLAEGSNLYFTPPRVEAIVNPIVSRIDQDIADEAQARADADAAEATARSNADTALQNQIDSLSGDVAALPIESGDSDTLAAAKAYADVQDGVTLQSAKDYADAHKATVEAGYSAGDSALNDALVAGDAATLASAKAYADAIEASGQAKDATQDTAIQANADAIAQEVLDRVAGDNQLQSAIDSLTSGLQDVRTDFGTGDDNLNSAIQAVDARVDAILDGSTVDLDSLKEIVDAFQGADSDLQNVMTSNSSRLSAAEADIDALETAMTARIGEIGNINTDITDVNARLDQEIIDRVSAIQPIPGLIDSGDAATLAAAKAHADSGDAVLQSAIDAANAVSSGIDSRLSSVEVGHPVLISDGDAATLAAAKAYTDAELSSEIGPILNVEIPGLKGKDSDQDVRLSALEAADVSLSGRLDSDRLEWIGADSALDVRVSTLETEMDDVESRLDSDRLEWIGKDSDERAERIAADLALGQRIDNLIANTDSVALNSLSELVDAFQNADNSLTTLVNTNTSDISSLQLQINGNDGDILGLDGRVGTLETSMTQAQQDIIDLPDLIKGDFVGGLCITYDPVTATIAIDEAEVRSQLVTHDADNLGGNDPSHYRINVYRVDGTLVN